jgi:23S rRNA pseudouridine2605 synthase
MPEQPSERLHKVLAHAGIASRRKAEELILQGRVTVNGKPVTQLGTKVDPARDDIRVDGQRIHLIARHVYIVLNKPAGVLSTMHDPGGRRSLGDLVSTRERLYPVGRLDADSEGLILLTDDGEVANLLTHPRHEHDKEYRVLVNGTPSEQTLAAWRRGVVLEGERTAPAAVDVLRKERDATLLRVTMHEGRKRQIRNVAALLGHPVREIQRVRIGPLHLGSLQPGQWRHLTEEELAALEALKAPGGKKKPARPRAAQRPRTPPAEPARPRAAQRPRTPPEEPARRPRPDKHKRDR